MLARCVAALRAQRLPEGGCELVVVDNASEPAILPSDMGAGDFPFPARIVRESELGLSAARRRGANEARGGVVVFVDDDNFLAPDFLRATERFFEAHPRAGAVGGIVAPLGEKPLPEWFDAVAAHLAIRNLGAEPKCLSQTGWGVPVGAGLALRKDALLQALSEPMLLADRKGRRLSSGGDSELCFRIRVLGWEIWYDPALKLHHFLPEKRLSLDHLEGLARSFGANVPWLEFYSFPDIPWRRLFYLRRASYHWRLAARTRRRIAGAATERERIERRLEAAGYAGIAASCFQLSWSAPVWKIAARVLAKGGQARS